MPKIRDQYITPVVTPKKLRRVDELVLYINESLSKNFIFIIYSHYFDNISNDK